MAGITDYWNINEDIDNGQFSSLHEKLSLARLRSDEIMERFGDKLLKKERSLSGLRDVTAIMTDQDSGYYINDNFERVPFRITGLAKFDSMDKLAAINRSRYKQSTQLPPLARMLNKSVHDLTEDDVKNYANYQAAESAKVINDASYQPQPYNPLERYATPEDQRMVRLSIRDMGQDMYGRRLVNAVNPRNNVDIGFELGKRAQTNTSFSLYDHLDTAANRAKLAEYEAGMTEDDRRRDAMIRAMNVQDRDGRLAEDLDIVQSSFRQTYARGRELVAHVFGGDVDYWRQQASREAADHWAGVKPQTREEQDLAMQEAMEDLRSGNRMRGILKLALQVDRTLGDSAAQIALMAGGGAALRGGLWAIGKIGQGLGRALVGPATQAATAGTPPVTAASSNIRRMLRMFPAGSRKDVVNTLIEAYSVAKNSLPGAALAAADQTMMNIAEYEASNPGKRMSTGDIVSNYLGNVALLVPDAIMIATGLKGIAGRASFGVTSGESILGSMAKGFIGEGIQEYAQDTFNTLYTQSEDERKSLGEIMRSPEAEVSFWAGGLAGAAMSGAGATLKKAAGSAIGKGAEALQARRTRQAEAQQQQAQQQQQAIRQVVTPSGQLLQGATPPAGYTAPATPSPMGNIRVATVQENDAFTQHLDAAANDGKHSPADIISFANDLMQRSKTIEYSMENDDRATDILIDKVVDLIDDPNSTQDDVDNLRSALPYITDEMILKARYKRTGLDLLTEQGRREAEANHVDVLDEFLSFAASLGIDRRGVFNTLEEVEQEVFDDARIGVNSYMVKAGQALAVANDPNSTPDEVRNAIDAASYYSGKIEHLANIQVEKAIEFSRGMQSASITGQDTDVRYGNRWYVVDGKRQKGSTFTINRTNPSGAVRTFEAIRNSYVKMGQMLSQLRGDPDILTAYQKQAADVSDVFFGYMASMDGTINRNYGKQRFANKTSQERELLAANDLMDLYNNKSLSGKQRRMYEADIMNLSDEEANNILQEIQNGGITLKRGRAVGITPEEQQGLTDILTSLRDRVADIRQRQTRLQSTTQDILNRSEADINDQTDITTMSDRNLQKTFANTGNLLAVLRTVNDPEAMSLEPDLKERYKKLQDEINRRLGKQQQQQVQTQGQQPAQQGQQNQQGQTQGQQPSQQSQTGQQNQTQTQGQQQGHQNQTQGQQGQQNIHNQGQQGQQNQQGQTQGQGQQNQPSQNQTQGQQPQTQGQNQNQTQPSADTDEDEQQASSTTSESEDQQTAEPGDQQEASTTSEAEEQQTGQTSEPEGQEGPAQEATGQTSEAEGQEEPSTTSEAEGEEPASSTGESGSTVQAFGSTPRTSPFRSLAARTRAAQMRSATPTAIESNESSNAATTDDQNASSDTTEPVVASDDTQVNTSPIIENNEDEYTPEQISDVAVSYGEDYFYKPGTKKRNNADEVANTLVEEYLENGINIRDDLLSISNDITKTDKHSVEVKKFLDIVRKKIDETLENIAKSWRKQASNTEPKNRDALISKLASRYNPYAARYILKVAIEGIKENTKNKVFAKKLLEDIREEIRIRENKSRNTTIRDAVTESEHEVIERFIESVERTTDSNVRRSENTDNFTLDQAPLHMLRQLRSSLRNKMKDRINRFGRGSAVVRALSDLLAQVETAINTILGKPKWYVAPIERLLDQYRKENSTEFDPDIIKGQSTAKLEQLASDTKLTLSDIRRDEGKKVNNIVQYNSLSDLNRMINAELQARRLENAFRPAGIRMLNLPANQLVRTENTDVSSIEKAIEKAKSEGRDPVFAITGVEPTSTKVYIDTDANSVALSELVQGVHNFVSFNAPEGNITTRERIFGKTSYKPSRTNNPSDFTGMTSEAKYKADQVLRSVTSTDGYNSLRNDPVAYNLAIDAVGMIFGKNLDSPVDFVVAYIPRNAAGEVVGRTAIIAMIANQYGIPIYNLANKATVTAMYANNDLGISYSQSNIDDNFFGVYPKETNSLMRTVPDVLSREETEAGQFPEEVSMSTRLQALDVEAKVEEIRKENIRKNFDSLNNKARRDGLIGGTTEDISNLSNDDTTVESTPSETQTAAVRQVSDNSPVSKALRAEDHVAIAGVANEQEVMDFINNEVLGAVSVTEESARQSGVAIHGFDPSTPEFSKEQRAKYEQSLPSVDDKLLTTTGEKVNSPVPFFYGTALQAMPHLALLCNLGISGKKGNQTPRLTFIPYMFTCLQLARMEWLSRGSIRSLLQDPDNTTLATMFGRSENNVSGSHFPFLRHVAVNMGMGRRNIAMQLGEMFMNIAGLVPSRDTELSRVMFNRLKLGVGDIIVNMMVQDGLLEFNTYNPIEEYCKFVNDGKTISEITSGPNGDEALQALLDGFTQSGLLSIFPGKRTAENENASITEDDIKNMEWPTILSVRTGQAFADGNRAGRDMVENTKRVYLGNYVLGERIDGLKHRLGITCTNDRGPFSAPVENVSQFVERTDHVVRIDDMNRDALRSLQNQAFTIDMPMLDLIVENPDVFASHLGYVLEPELRLMDAESRISALGKNKAIASQIESLIVWHRAVKDGVVGPDVFFKWFSSIVGRHNIDSNTLNPQSGKQLTRFLVRPKGLDRVYNNKEDLEAQEKIDVPGLGEVTRERLTEAGAVAQAFDLLKNAATAMRTLEAFENLKLEQLEYLLKESLAKKTLNEFVADLHNMGIAGAGVENVGQVMVALDHLIKKKKANGAKFTSGLAAEADSTTSNVFIRYLLTPTEDLEANGTSKRVGIMDDGSAPVNMHEYKKIPGNRDAYQAVGQKASEDLVNNLDLKYDQDGNPSFNEQEAKKRINSNKFVRIAHDVTFNVFKMVLPALPTVDITKSIDKALREIIKYPTMIKNYTGGARAIMDGLVGDIVRPMVQEYYSMKQYYIDGKVDAELYIKNKGFTGREAARARAVVNMFNHIDQLTKKQLSKPLLQLLETKSIGEIFIETYTWNNKLKKNIATRVSVYEYLHAGIAPVYGQAILNAIDEIYASLETYAKYQNAVSRVIARIAHDVFETFKSMNKISDDVPLTHGQWSELLEKIRPFLPIFPSAFSVDPDGGITVAPFEQDLNDQSSSVNVIYTNDKGQRQLGNLFAPNTTLSANIGQKAAVYFIQSQDANGVAMIVAQFVANGKTGILPIFDAFIANPLMLSQICKQYNINMYNLAKGWDSIEVTDQRLRSVLNSLEEVQRDPAFAKAWGELSSKKRFIDLDNLGDLVTELMEPGQADQSMDISELLTLSKDTVDGNKANRDDFYSRDHQMFNLDFLDSSVNTSRTDPADQIVFDCMKQAEDKKNGFPNVVKSARKIISRLNPDMLTRVSAMKILRTLESMKKMLSGVEEANRNDAVISDIERLTKKITDRFTELEKVDAWLQDKGSRADKLFRKASKTLMSNGFAHALNLIQKNGIESVLSKILQNYIGDFKNVREVLHGSQGILSRLETLMKSINENENMKYLVEQLHEIAFMSGKAGPDIMQDLMLSIAQDPSKSGLTSEECAMLTEYGNLISVMTDPESGTVYFSDPLQRPSLNTVGTVLSQAQNTVEGRIGTLNMIRGEDEADGRRTCSAMHHANLCTLMSAFHNNSYDRVTVEVREDIRNTGEYNDTKRRVFIGRDNRTQDIDPVTKYSIYSHASGEEIYAHEMLHAATIFAFSMQTDPWVKGEITKITQLMIAAKDHLTVEDFMPDVYDPALEQQYRDIATKLREYALTRPEEFISYGLAHEKLARKLKTIPYGKQKSGGNIFSRLMSGVIQLFKHVFGGQSTPLTDRISTLLAGNMSFRAKSNMYDELLRLSVSISQANERVRSRIESKPHILHQQIFSALKDYLRIADDKGKALLQKLGSALKGTKLEKSVLNAINNSSHDFAGLVFRLSARLALMPFSPDMRQTAVEAYRIAMRNYQQSFIASLIRDMTPHDQQTQKLHEMYSLTRTYERLAKVIESTIYNSIAALNGGSISDSQEYGLFNAVLRIDAQSLGISGSQLKTLLTSEAAIDKRIASLEADLESHIDKWYTNKTQIESLSTTTSSGMLDRESVGNWVKSQINALAYYMVTGKGNEAMLANATQIIQSFNTTYFDSSKSKRLVKPEARDFMQTVDRLATMIAMKHLDQDSKTFAASVTNECLDAYMKSHGKYVQEYYDGTRNDESGQYRFDNDYSQSLKGYYKNLYDDSIELDTKPLANAKLMDSMGYDLVGPVPDDGILGTKNMAIYRRTSVRRGSRNGTGIMARGEEFIGKSLRNSAYELIGPDHGLVSSHVEYGLGELRAQAHRLHVQFLSKPFSFSDFEKLKTSGYVDSGTDNAYLTMSMQDKRNLLNIDESGLKVLSKMYASRSTRLNATYLNSQILDFLVADMKANMNPATHTSYNRKYEYIQIHPESENKMMKDLWRMVPPSIKREALNSAKNNGGGLWMRSDWVDAMFGVEAKSLANSKIMQKILNPKAIRWLSIGEYILQSIVSIAKQNIVLKVPGVLISNILTNAIQTINRGYSPVTVFKMTMSNVVATRQYLKDYRHFQEILYRERTGSATSEDAITKKALIRKMDANQVAPLIQRGVLQTVVEEMTSNDVEAIGRLRRFKAFRTVADKTPAPVKRVLRELYMDEGTFVYKFMNAATQYSDFASRCTEYQLRMKDAPKKFLHSYDTEPTKAYKDYEARVMHEVYDQFVNYDVPQSAPLQYINDMGIMMFTKFFTRIQKQNFRNFANRPVSTILGLIGFTYLMDMDTITDHNVLSYNPMNLVHTPWENISNVAVPIPIQFATGMRDIAA